MIKAVENIWAQLGALDAYLTSFTFDDSHIPYFELALGFLIVDFVFHTYLELRQRRVLQTGSPPTELGEHYSDEYVQKTRAYSLHKMDFGLVKSVFDVLDNLVVLKFMLLPFFWRLAATAIATLRPHLKDSEYAVSAAFFIIINFVETMKNIPWGLYSTFVIEERHGFNKQTLRLFFADIVKSQLLVVVITPPILTCTIYILQIGSSYMALYLWLFLITVQLVAMLVYPALIAPLFNKFKPLEPGELKNSIEDLASTLGFPLKKLFVVDGSTRSGHSNAYMYGFGRSKRIVLYDTLLKQCEKDEQVVAILAHELGHWKLWHTTCLMVASQLVMLKKFVLFTVVRNSEHLLNSFGFTEEKPVIVALMLFMMLNSPVDNFVTWLFNLLSRRFEFQADNFAVKLNHADALVEALKILEKENKSTFAFDPLYSSYHHSHPPLIERLKAIWASAKKML